MKKNIFTLFVLFFTSISFGQKLSLADLIKLEKANIDDFDTYVTTKGYTYLKRGVEDNADAITYSYIQTDSSKCGFIKKFTTQKGNRNLMITYKTNSIEYYLFIKTELKTLGFKFISSEDINGDTASTYEKGQLGNGLIRVMIITRQKKNESIGECRGYEISVWD